MEATPPYPPDSEPPGPEEDTGSFLTYPPELLTPEQRRRVTRRLREQSLAKGIERRLRAQWWKTIVAIAAAILLPATAGLLLVGAYRERVDTLQRSVERLEAKVDRLLERQR